MLELIGRLFGKPKTHDYTQRYWGHDYTFDPIDEGMRGSVCGWGKGISRGDYLLLQNGNGATRYRVESIRYYEDPPDMWSAEVRFTPRPNQTIEGRVGYDRRRDERDRREGEGCGRRRKHGEGLL